MTNENNDEKKENNDEKKEPEEGTPDDWSEAYETDEEDEKTQSERQEEEGGGEKEEEAWREDVESHAPLAGVAPESAPDPVENKKRKKGTAKRQPFRTLIVPIAAATILIVILFTGYSFYRSSRESGLPETAKIARPSSSLEQKVFEPGAETSPEYAKKLREYEAQREAEAEEAGVSHIPSVLASTKDSGETNQRLDELERETITLQPATEEAQSQPSPAIVHAPARPAPAAGVNKADPNYLLMVQTYQAAQAAHLYEMQAGITYPSAATITAGTTITDSAESLVPTEPPTNNPTWQQPAPFTVGQVVYAANAVAVNSDVPGPVMVEVLHGPQRGGKFIGAFAVHGQDKLLITFNRYIDTDNKESVVTAYAVDPTEIKPGVSSRVKNRTFSRWAALVAASFIEGFGEAAGKAGSTSTTSLGAGAMLSQTSHLEYDTEKQAWIAAGKVGGKVAPIVEQYFHRAPTVYLDRGTPVGVLIIGLDKAS